ncbi:nuclear transport factor 2 family protein [Denitrobaculum tricleocarpae]|uniref:Nuclear transport factor 2 family protein n=1 Tax=Denitrobaculum tricleocarpae TaxID=2591009 RepID=A0A545T7Y0_9PROT|nr:nuclear transport factor 2 family protein [Denitrobaculum tricleocarpae]TQV73329.1 nuclear transport factor 2 family protein [Denitrobaculum tricleocarpae]
MKNTELAALIDRYCAAWRERDAGARAAILEAVWHDDGRYSDPTVEVEGRIALCNLIGETQARFPGSEVVRLSEVDSHHGTFRFTWKMQTGEGKQLPESIDFGRLSSDGRILEIVGFFGLIGGEDV